MSFLRSALMPTDVTVVVLGGGAGSPVYRRRPG